MPAFVWMKGSILMEVHFGEGLLPLYFERDSSARDDMPLRRECSNNLGREGLDVRQRFAIHD